MTRKWMYVGAAAIGLTVVAVLVAVSLAGGRGSSAATPATVAMGPQTAALLAGIPQHGETLGSPTAPVTLVEYADLQCPYCGEFARSTLPTLIREYVRPGKVKLVFRGLAFVGPDSDTALRAVYAAGQQNRLWSYGALMFENQGNENTGWVTEELIESLAAAVPGLDAEQLLAARQTPPVTEAIAIAASRGRYDGVSGTPWFGLGRSGGAMQTLRLSSLEPPAFTAAFDRLLDS